MKKGIAIALLLCLLVSIFSIASAASVKLAIKGGRICLRTGAGKSYSVICHLKDGQKITVISKGNSWSKVRTEAGKEGYIKNLYISGIGSYYADGTKYYGTHKKAYISGDGNANLRAGASSSTGLLKPVKSGAAVTLLGENGSWKLVLLSDGTQGYISNKRISETKSKTTSSSSTTSTGKAYVNASGLYMREGPGMSYKAITCLKRNTTVSIVKGTGKGWWLVKYGNLTGYMWSGYLTKK